MATLRTAALQVLEMQVLQPDLEEVFIRIMGTHKIRQPEALSV